jgi:hypothetical protein
MKSPQLRNLSILAFSLLAACSQADEAQFWNDIALKAIKAANYAPPIASRNLAITSIAQADAVNAISGFTKGYSYSGSSTIANASKEAAVAAAAYNTLKQLFPTQQTLIDQAYNDRRNALGSSAAVIEGLRLGSESATSILNLRSNDKSSLANTSYPGSTDIGKWRPTGSASALLPGWGNVDTFGINSAKQFAAGGPPSLTSVEYANAYNEVKAYGASNSTIRTAEQTDIAKVWAAGAGTVTPPGMWNEIATQAGTVKGNSLEDNLRMYGTLNVALADAAIASWDTKYTYSFWRPVTAIRNGDLDGNSATAGDATWTSLLTTPPHPSYTSGHSTFSAAGAAVLGTLFGDNVSFTVTSPDTPGVARNFNSFSAAAAEAGQSRIFGGIHYQFDNQIGLTMGQQIGNYVTSNTFQPVPEPATIAAIGFGLLGLSKRRKKK